jgi:hypothetical protein
MDSALFGVAHGVSVSRRGAMASDVITARDVGGGS